MKNISYIYTLSDPDTNEIRYVGKTINLNKRYSQHINLNNIKSNTHRDNWMVKVIRSGKLPIFDVLDEVNSDEWKYWEIYWISQIKTWGFNLTNSNEGGEGGICSEETKKKISEKQKGNKYRIGCKHSDIAKLNMSNAQKGKKQSIETINKRVDLVYKSIDINKIKDEYDKGLSYEEIGEIFNLSRSKIYRELKKNKLLIGSKRLYKRIICIETNIIYDSITHAKKSGDANSSIYRALKENRTSNGYHWKYID
jgi:hypothetical protein